MMLLKGRRFWREKKKRKSCGEEEGQKQREAT